MRLRRVSSISRSRAPPRCRHGRTVVSSIGKPRPSSRESCANWRTSDPRCSRQGPNKRPRPAPPTRRATSRCLGTCHGWLPGMCPRRSRWDELRSWFVAYRFGRTMPRRASRHERREVHALVPRRTGWADRPDRARGPVPHFPRRARSSGQGHISVMSSTAPARPSGRSASSKRRTTSRIPSIEMEERNVHDRNRVVRAIVRPTPESCGAGSREAFPFDWSRKPRSWMGSSLRSTLAETTDLVALCIAEPGASTGRAASLSRTDSVRPWTPHGGTR